MKKYAELEMEKEKLLSNGIWCNNRTNALLNVFDHIGTDPDAVDIYLKELYDNDFLKVHFNINKEEVYWKTYRVKYSKRASAPLTNLSLDARQNSSRAYVSTSNSRKLYIKQIRPTIKQ